MSFTDQKPFTVTDKMLTYTWGGGGLRCSLCGMKFKSGDVARWVYCNSSPELKCHNFMTCQNCDGEDVAKRGSDSYEKAVSMAKAWGIYGPDWQRD